MFQRVIRQELVKVAEDRGGDLKLTKYVNANSIFVALSTFV